MRTVLAILAVVAASLAAAGEVREVSGPPPEAETLPGFSQPVERIFAQLYWDAEAGRLNRRSHVFHDPLLSGPDVEVFWQPDAPLEDKAGPINGPGTLVWRSGRAGAPDVVARYQGDLRDGRLDGKGVFVHRSGARYEGDWREGRMHGQGRLQLPSGDEYIGQFEDGRRSGHGRYVDRFGTVYDGMFAAGLREGTGTVYPADGRAWRAAFRAGQAVEGSQVPVPGDPGIAHVQPSQYLNYPDAQVGVGVLYHDLTHRPTFAPIQYLSAADGETLVVYPGDQTLLDFIYGNANIAGPGAAIVTNAVRHLPVDFQFSLENTSTLPLRVVGAYLDVTSAISERRPVFTMSPSTYVQNCAPTSPMAALNCSGGPITAYLSFFNSGWGAAENMRVDLAIRDRAGTEITRVAIDTGTVPRQVDVDISTVLAGLGMNLAYIKETGFPCASSEQCMPMLQASGAYGAAINAISYRLGNIWLPVEGAVSFQWTDALGVRQSASVPFSREITVGFTRGGAEEGEDAMPDPIRTDPFVLPLDQGPYRITLPIPVVDIMAGRTNTWTMRLTSAMSSISEFRIVLQLSDGRLVASRPLRMVHFLPNMHAGN